ncbi:MAG: CsgG/HfaB family protein, partial [bacterium]
MRFSKSFVRLMLGAALLLGLDFQMAEGLAQWHLFYRTGLQAMERGDWNRAIENFQQAIRVKALDSKKIRATGVMFIEYFPHREMGICYFHLGDRERARQELTLSLAQEPSERARNFLARLNRGERASDPPSVTPPSPQPAATTPPRAEPAASTLIGERLSIAVLPFESKGIGGALGQIDLLDKLVTGFVGINRFKVIERAQLERILEEQKLGMSGVIDASTAAQIGKGIGVDGVVFGS